MTRIPVSSYSYSYFVFFCFSPLSVCLLLRFTACVAQIQGVFALQNNTIFFQLRYQIKWNFVKNISFHQSRMENCTMLRIKRRNRTKQHADTYAQWWYFVYFHLHIPLVTVVIPILYIKRFSFRLICNEDDDNDDLFVWILNADAFAIPPIV